MKGSPVRVRASAFGDLQEKSARLMSLRARLSGTHPCKCVFQRLLQKTPVSRQFARESLHKGKGSREWPDRELRSVSRLGSRSERHQVVADSHEAWLALELARRPEDGLAEVPVARQRSSRSGRTAPGPSTPTTATLEKPASATSLLSSSARWKKAVVKRSESGGDR
jgi:hypothetical protein